MELNHWQPELGYGPRGYFGFDGGVTTLAPSGSPNQYNAYAAFLLGDASFVTKSLQYETMTGREWQYALYVRDRWQVNKKLTLNLGVRWELYPMMTRANRGIEYYDPTNNTVLLGGLGGNPETFNIKVQYPHFLPRIGVDYRLTENDVIRAGYGITVSPLPL
jgi:outer membrane receptor protein involved in Fe transport